MRPRRTSRAGLIFHCQGAATALQNRKKFSQFTILSTRFSFNLQRYRKFSRKQTALLPRQSVLALTSVYSVNSLRLRGFGVKNDSPATIPALTYHVTAARFPRGIWHSAFSIQHFPRDDSSAGCACLAVVTDGEGRGLAAVSRAFVEWCRSRGQSPAPLGTREKRPLEGQASGAG